MNTAEFLDREIRKTKISIERANKKPNAQKAEKERLEEKLMCLNDALNAVLEREN